MAYNTLLIETPAEGVTLIRLNRPAALNALNAELVAELMDALTTADRDDTIGCILLAGNERAFAAGADIKAFAAQTAVDLLQQDHITDWSRMAAVKKPIIAVVRGFALGGGCELALACDLILAGESVLFGQPEISIGIIPGAGGTQRLTHAVGKAIAMEMILADRKLTGEEAARFGLVNRVIPDDNLETEAVKLAVKIAGMPRVAVALAKDAVNSAYEVGLAAGLAHEKRNFLLAFGTEDKTEGMDAFITKRKPQWKHK
jgi:enoyl-CoA hydratase